MSLRKFINDLIVYLSSLMDRQSLRHKGTIPFRAFFSQKDFLLILLTVLLLAGFPFLPFAHATPPYYDDPFYKQKGTDRIPATFQQVAESVNPFTGNVNLTHTDVSLPGNGGLDLKIIRAYNGRIYGAKDPYSGQAPLVAATERSVLGVGWSFHFGRVINPEGKVYSAWYTEPPMIEMPDGASHPVYVDKNNSNQRISKEFWIYRRNTANTGYELVLTDGTVYTFSDSNNYKTAYTGETILPVSAITTPDGHTTTFTYTQYNPNDPNRIGPSLMQSITDSVGRLITFTYKDILVWDSGVQVSRKALDTMTLNGRVYTYRYKTFYDQFSLEEVVPPVGQSWKYSYYEADPQKYEMMTVTYPTGAIITYGYNYRSFEVGTKDQWGSPTPNQFLVVTTRSLSGRDITPAYWDYYYSNDSNGDQVTTVTQSGCNKTEIYTYKSLGSVLDNYGNPYRVTYGSIPISVTPPQLWQVGMPLKKTILSGSTVQEEVYNWMAGTLISNETLKSGYWVGSYIYDNGIYVPTLSSKVITRDGKSYKTAYSNYDNYGNPQTTNEYGGWTQFQGRDNGENIRTTTSTYYTDSVRNIVKGHTDVHKVDNAFPTDYGYDANGNVATLNRYGVVTTLGYTNGNVTSRTNALNYTTNIQYTYGTVSGITNPIYTISREINWDGTIASETDGRGNTTHFTYDNLGRLTRITPPLDAVLTISYDNIDSVTGEMYWQEAKGSWYKKYYIDGLGRIIRTEDSEGLKVSTAYNACGQIDYKSYPYTTTNIGDSFVYDVLGRVTRINHPDNSFKTFTYSSGNVSITNERGITTAYTNKAFGNPDEKLLSSVTDYTGTTSYDYNAVGSLTKITHPNGLTRSFSYDSRNFLISETHPETGTISYSLDAIGNITQRTDGKGIINFTYDPINRLTNIDYPGTADDTAFIYDNANNRTAISSSAVSYSNTYNAQNRLSQQILSLDGRSFTTSYGYDNVGNLTALTYSTGRTITYTYDSVNRVKGLAGYVTDVTYHPSGGMASISYGNGKTTTFSYNNRYWVNSLKVNTWNTTPYVIDYNYTYDMVGNVTNLNDLLDTRRSRSMGYDNADRITFASGIWGLMDFGYDALGNNTSKTVNGGSTTYTYSPTTNLLTSASGAEADSYNYDANSNIESIRGHSLVYDYANRLTGVDGGAETYVYDGDGKRVKKVKKANNVINEIVLYHYDPSGNTLAEETTDAFGKTKQVEYLYLNGQHAAKIENDGDTPLNIPNSLNVNTANQNSVAISWTIPTAGVHHYEIWRSDQKGAYILLSTTTQTSYTDNSVQSGRAYLYRIRAVDVSGNIIYYSDIGLTTTINFADDPLIPRETLIRAQHIVDLRTAVNTVRSNAGLVFAQWTDSDSSLSGGLIRVVHIQELRDRLIEALTTLGISTPSWVNPNLSGEFIKAEHLNQLRREVK